MKKTETTTVAPGKPRMDSTHHPAEDAPTPLHPHRRAGGFLTQYKPEQGRGVRTGTFVGAGLLSVWGAYFIYDHMQVYVGDELWRLLITLGIPILFAVVLGTVVWRVAFVSHKPGDFMIATEGEMKKVSWSTKREVIGSTKVVILFTLLMALLLFVVDVVFQYLFKVLGVLKV